MAGTTGCQRDTRQNGTNSAKSAVLATWNGSARLTQGWFGMIVRYLPHRMFRVINARSLVLVVMSVAALGARPLRAQQPGPNGLSVRERSAGWKLLFDGTTFAGWRGLGYDSVPSAHWNIVQGAIHKIPSGSVPRMKDGQPAVGGDLMTTSSFRDFELAFEWKVAPGANSGVKYNVSEEMSMKAAPNHAALGFEYQVLDDALNDDNKIPSHRAGALYDMIPPNENKRLMPVGQWNQSVIVLKGNHGEHWLNGAIVVRFDLKTAHMDSLVAASKYHVIPGFADHREGHIVLQDHADEAWFRSIKIRELKP